MTTVKSSCIVPDFIFGIISAWTSYFKLASRCVTPPAGAVQIDICCSTLESIGVIVPPVSIRINRPFANPPTVIVVGVSEAIFVMESGVTITPLIFITKSALDNPP